MEPQTRTLILGDSHVRRLHDFIRAPPTCYESCVDTSVEATTDITFHGVGGRSVKNISRLDLPVVQELLPHVIILMVGGNDLCDPKTSPLKVASDIHDLAMRLLHTDACYMVFVLSIPPRASYPAVNPTFIERVDECNKILHQLLDSEEEVYYWKIRGLHNPTVDIFTQDGIHLNGRGSYKLYRSVRGALLKGLTIMDRLRGGKSRDY